MIFLKGFSKQSIRFKLTIGLLLLVIPLQALLFYDNYYAMNVVRDQVAISNRNLTTLYMDQIDRNLEEVGKYLKLTVAFESDLYMLDVLEEYDSDLYHMAKINLYNKLERDITNYKSIDLLFVYSSVNEDLIAVQHLEGTPGGLHAVKAGIVRMLKEKAAANKHELESWFVYKMKDDYYLCKLQKFGNVYVGGWVQSSKLMVPLSLLNIGQTGKSMLVTDRFESMDGHAGIGASDEFLHVSTQSKQGNFSLLILIPYRDILERLPDLRRVWSFVLLGSLFILPFFYIYLRQVILVPINRIVAVMRRVRDGNLEQRVEKVPVSYEFELMNDVFNGMVSQIKQLKINVYEEQLLVQKAELKHLQLQINPHFYLNSLNTIYNLAQFQNYGLIRQMSEYLINYTRFMFQSNLKFVSLAEEIAHTRNYLQIQEMRFHEGFTYAIESCESLSAARIPPLIIQTFVENTIKHAITMNEPIRLFVDIRLCRDNDSYIRIIIRDTGKGFPEEMIVHQHSDKEMIHEGTEHIGIWNARRRLRLIYRDRASLALSNHTDGGAMVAITLPLYFEDEPAKGELPCINY